jgi:multicomponent Na+:H+ antiporter subunit C
MENLIVEKLNYWVFIILMMLGLWAILAKKNLIKKLLGMSIFQAAVIMFYVSIGAKDQHASIPIYPHDLIHPPHEEVVHHKSSTEDHGHAHQGDETSDATHSPDHGHVAHGEHPKIASKINPDDYDNPIPHVLMLTAIVVGVATLGVALSLVQRLFRLYGSIEEDEILNAMTTREPESLSIASLNRSEKEPTQTHA